MNEREVIAAVVKNLYPPRRWAVCPNVSWGLLTWEADILAVSAAGSVHEIEVKTSRGDLLREKMKRKWFPSPGGLIPSWSPRSLLDAFYLAVPDGLFEVAEAVAMEIRAGIITVTPSGDAFRRLCCRWPKRPAEAKNKNPITQAQVWRLCAMRYWDREARATAERERSSDGNGGDT